MPKSPSTSRALVISGPISCPPRLLVELDAAFTEVAIWPADRAFRAMGFRPFEFILVLAGPQQSSLDFAFAMIRHINELRFTSTRRNIPEVIVVTVTPLSGSVVADLQDHGCHVRVQSPEELRQTIDALRTQRTRAKRRGIHLQIITIEETRAIFVVAADRFVLASNTREVRLLLKLNSEDRAFSERELATIFGWTPGQVRMYLKRIRDHFEERSPKIGIVTRADEFIEQCGKGGGWKLNAWIEKKSRD